MQGRLHLQVALGARKLVNPTILSTTLVLLCTQAVCKALAQCTSLLCRSSAGAAGSAFPAAHRGQCGPAASEGGSLDATRLLGLEAEIPEYNIATCLPFENIQREKRRRDEPSPDSPSRVSPIKIVPSR